MTDDCIIYIKLNIYQMDKNIKEMKQKLAKYERMEDKWNQQREFYRKSIALMQEQITKCKAINANLLKKAKHKRTCSEEQMFIFNQTNISSYYPVVMVSKPTTWVPKANMRSHLDSVRTLCWQGKFLLSGGEDCLLKIWDKDRLRMTVREHLAPIYTICGDNQTVFTAGAEGVIREWDVPSFAQQPRPVKQLQAHEDSIWELSWNPVNHRLVSSSSDGTLKVIHNDNQQLKEILQISLTPQTPTSISFLTNQKLVCGLTSNSKISVFDFEKQCRIQDFIFQGKQRFSQTNKILYWQNRGLVVSGHQDRVIRFFDTNSGKCVKSLVAHSDAVTSLCLKKPEHQELYSVSHDGSFRAWDLREFRCNSDVGVHMQKYDESALCIQHSLQEHMVAVGGADGQIKLLCPEN